MKQAEAKKIAQALKNAPDDVVLKLWNKLDDKDKEDFKKDILNKLTVALGEAGAMRQANSISWQGYKKIMNEFLSQNPLYKLYLKGKL